MRQHLSALVLEQIQMVETLIQPETIKV